MTVLGGRMFGRCLGHEAGDLRNGIGTYIRDSRETPSLTHHVRYKEKVLVMNQEWHVDIGIPAPRTVRNKFLLFISYLVCDILLYLPKELRCIVSFKKVITEENIRYSTHFHGNCTKR